MTDGPLQVDRFLLPPGDDEVLLHFLEHHFVAHSARERLRGLAARGTLRLGMPSAARRLLSRSAPPSPESSHPGPRRPGDDVPPAIPRTFPASRGRSIRLLDYPGGGRSGSVTFVFPPGAHTPSMVVKARPSGASAPPLHHERDALVALRSRLPAQLRATVPELLGYAVGNGTEILSISFLPGRPAYVDMNNRMAPVRRVAAHMEAASLWLARFHEATMDGRTPLDPERELPDPLEVVERVRGGDSPHGGVGDPDLRWYRTLRETLARTPLSGSAVHGDFWARNLLLDAGRPMPAVVDWEHYRPRGLPASDLFHFPLTYGVNHPWVRYRRRPPLEAFRRTFLERNRVSRAVRGYFVGYGRARGMDLALLRQLFLLHLLDPGMRGNVDDAEVAARPAPEEAPWISAYALMVRSHSSVFSS